MSWVWKPLFTLGIAACAMGVSPALAATDPDWDQARQITVELSNFDFTPKTLILHHGQPYRLHLTNTGSGGHNFSSPAFFKAATIAPEDAAVVAKGGIDLKKGESRDVRIIPAKGRYKLKCTHFMHSTFGMKGEIVVD
jgi:uncharacterized cupredoxin-like copper-binding protein